MLEALDVKQELRKFFRFRDEHKEWCNFEQDEVLTPEKIIRATFCNLDRRKHQRSIKNIGKLTTIYRTADDLIEKIKSDLPKASAKMVFKKIKLHDTRRLFEAVD
jgi:hypothetical protein